MFTSWRHSFYLQQVPQEGCGTHLLQKLICILGCVSASLPSPRLVVDPGDGPARRTPGLVSRPRVGPVGRADSAVPLLPSGAGSFAAPGGRTFPASLSGRPAPRPRALLPEVRAPARRSAPSVRASGGQFRGESTPSRPPLPARRAGRRVAGLAAAAARGWALPRGDCSAEGGNAEVCSPDGQMRLASRSACAAAAPRRVGPPPSAPRAPRGRRGARQPWPRCRAQSGARSRSRSTGKARRAGRWTRGRTAPAGRAPRAARRGAPETALPPTPSAPRGRRGGAAERATARSFPTILGHQRPFPERALGPPPQPRLARAALGASDRWPGAGARGGRARARG